MKKKNFIIVLTLVFVLGLVFIFSGCTILERIFNFGSSQEESSSSTVEVHIFFNNLLVNGGEIKIGLADQSGISPTWVNGFTPQYVDTYNGQSDLFFKIFDVPDGYFWIKVFIDINNNGDIDEGEPYGEGSINIYSSDMTYYSPEVTVENASIIKNSDFLNGAAVDNFGFYQYPADLSNYLNNNINGDYLPEWQYYIDENDLSYKLPEIIWDETGLVRWLTNNGIENGTNMWMEQDNVNYTVNSNSKFEIRFKIDSFDGGDFNPPYYEAPVKVMFKINNTWYLVKGFTTSVNYDAAYGEGTLSTGTYYLESYSIENLNITTDDGNQTQYTITSGDVIQAVRIKTNGWIWDVTFDYFKIIEQ